METTIESLPVEIITMILDQSRINGYFTQLLTCKLWHNIITSSNIYIEHKELYRLSSKYTQLTCNLSNYVLMEKLELFEKLTSDNKHGYYARIKLNSIIPDIYSIQIKAMIRFIIDICNIIITIERSVSDHESIYVICKTRSMTNNTYLHELSDIDPFLSRFSLADEYYARIKNLLEIMFINRYELLHLK